MVRIPLQLKVPPPKLNEKTDGQKEEMYLYIQYMKRGADTHTRMRTSYSFIILRLDIKLHLKLSFDNTYLHGGSNGMKKQVGRRKCIFV